MPQAASSPVHTPLSITETADTVTFSAYQGGIMRPSSDVPVTFAVTPESVAAFNEAHQTSYPIMPEGSYTIPAPSANIPAGQLSTGPLPMLIHTKGFLSPFVSYLLPVTLSQPGKTGTVNAALNTAYFLVTGSYEPGEVPREKTISLGADAGSFLIGFSEKFIRRDPVNGNLLLYTPDNAGLFSTPPATIGQGWDIFNLIFFYGGDRLIGRYADGAGDIAQYPISPEGQIGGGRTVGWGWGGAKDIVPYKGLLLGIDPGGAMTKYPLNADGEFDFGNISNISAGWAAFVHVFPYDNSLMAIEENGNMWQYPLSENGAFGDRRLVGTGWDMYVRVVPAGSDLLALDSNGDLWRYKFNPAGLWALKKN